MHLQTLFAHALLASSCAVLASPVKSRSPYAVKDSHPVPRGWTCVGRPTTDHLIDLRIGLKQSQFDDLERHLFEVSDPDHNRYGRHLSAAEVHDMVKPTKESSDLVHEWLYDNGVDASEIKYTPARDWIKLRLPVSTIERLLDTEYATYVREDGIKAVRAPTWSLPIHLHEHVSTIQPTNSFFGPRKQAVIDKRKSEIIADAAIDIDSLPPAPDAASVAAVCNISLVTPLCLRTLYGTLNYTVQAADRNTMSLNNFLGEVSIRPDAEKFLQLFRPEAVAAASEFEQISIAGGPVQDGPLDDEQLQSGTSLEANLDTQTMLGIAWPTPLKVYSTGGEPPFIPDEFTPENTNEPYLTWLEYILSQPDPLPSVVSTSYDDDEQTVPKSYAVQVCNTLAQLGARGVTVLFASGDSGVGSDGFCVSNDGTNSSTFLPNFPSTCPYITSVGGTYQFNPEVAVFRNRSGSIYTAGGGFSYYFPRPKYQNNAVPAYVANTVGSNYTGLYNPEGRGYPDIAAQSLYFATVWNNAVVPVSGTSAATPAAAGILTLVNDALIAANRSPLGFMNPWLYRRGYRAFNDILSGSSAGCGTIGFPAVAGWDAVTGLGTPNFPSILKLLGLGDDEGGYKGGHGGGYGKNEWSAWKS